jgi:NADP-dependent 3-hydroxy acid dehydrogenase YdfG
MAGELEGKVAIITGASSGIGEAIARLLAREGARVTLAARRRERIEALARTLEDEEGARVLAHPTDVAEPGQVEAMVKATLDAFGQVDILVNNAGIMPISPLAEARVDDWSRMVDVNVKGVLFAVGAVLPGMVERGGGHVVNIGSLAGRRPFPGGTIYAATKFAVRALTAGMQLELSAAHGIRVTDVQPGVVETELMDHIPSEGIRQGFADGWRNRRKLDPEDVARAVLFALSSPDRVNVNEILIRPTDQTT